MGKQESFIAKGIAVSMMLFHHLFLNEQEIMAHGGNLTLLFLSQEQLINIAQSFKVCVSVFVLISGYGAYLQLRKNLPGGGSLIVPRLVKLLLNYQFVYIAFALIGLAACSTYNITTVYGSLADPQSWVLMGVDFFGLAAAFQTPTLNATWWYMSVALLFITVAPFVYECGRRFGNGIVAVVSLLVPLLMGLVSTNAFRYLFIFCTGMFLANSEILNKFSSWCKRKSNGKCCFVVVLVVLEIFLLLFMRQKLAWNDSLAVVFEAMGAISICALSTLISHQVGLPLMIIGKHSMNIFLLHTFIFGYYWSQIVYKWNYPLIIFGVLLALSLLASLMIEKCKKLTGFDFLVEKISSGMSA